MKNSTLTSTFRAASCIWGLSAGPHASHVPDLRFFPVQTAALLSSASHATMQGRRQKLRATAVPFYWFVFSSKMARILHSFSPDSLHPTSFFIFPLLLLQAVKVGAKTCWTLLYREHLKWQIRADHEHGRKEV